MMLRSAFVLITLSGAVSAADWPRFRGPNGSGVAETSGLPDSIAPDKHVVWKTALPPGHSSPVISGDHIFVTAFDGDKLLTIALDRGSGRILWRREAPRDRREKLDSQNSPASPTPAADGRNVYIFFPDYGLLSYTFDGADRWRTRLGPFDNMYGMGVSPILAGDKVVLICDQSHDSFAAAFSQADGKQVWKTPRPEALSGHSTPTVYRPQGGGIQVIAPGSYRMDVYDLETGNSMWWVNGLPSEMKSVPVVDGDTVYINGFNTPFNDPGRHIEIPSFADALAKYDSNRDGALQQAELPEGPMRAYFPFEDVNQDGKLDAAEWKSFQAVMAAENGLLALRAGGAGDVTATALRWKYQQKIPQLPSMLIYRGVIYMINDGGILTTIDPANGQAFKQGRLRGAIDKYYASPVAADGKIFFVGNSGVVTILKAGPEQEILSVGQLNDDCFATPAIADGRVYIRTRGMLYCFGLEKATADARGWTPISRTL
ncbi:MAG TPA: PQQ-binding-like beta-propeller repeat protein [Bryobacteraceae bacterium]|nr:PQQ-binding-like beta-propeller repeat protein [Bryobacteraceae bacterium]